MWPDGTAEDAIVHDDPSETPTSPPAVTTPPAATPPPAVIPPSAASVPFPAPTPSASCPPRRRPATGADRVPVETPVVAEPDAVEWPAAGRTAAGVLDRTAPGRLAARARRRRPPRRRRRGETSARSNRERVHRSRQRARTRRVADHAARAPPPDDRRPCARAEVADPAAPTPAAPPAPADQPAGVRGSTAGRSGACAARVRAADAGHARRSGLRTCDRRSPGHTCCATDVADDPTTDATDDETLPGPGRASVVFVDDEPEPAAERRGALRRLISSLRHKDD